MTSSRDEPTAPGRPEGRFEVTYWGVRGSIPTPGPSTVRYGGNTICLEIRCDDRLIILDMGSGARLLGEALMADAKGAGVEADVLMSHCHVDHIIGFPFFAPLFDERTRLRIYGDDAKGVTTEEALRRLLSFPLFPVEYDALPAALTHVSLAPMDRFELGPVTVKTCALHHPGRALAYRLEHRGRALVHASDVEHEGDTPDPSLVDLCRGADLVNYDAMFTEGVDFDRHRGWGHSTWQAGVRLARAADVERLVCIHHGPGMSDVRLDAIWQDLRQELPRGVVAIEGMRVDLLALEG